MARISTSTNPTNLREISKRHISLLSTQVGEKRYFQVTNLELGSYGLRDDEKVFIVARAGNTSKRFDLGTVGSFDRGSLELGGLDASHPLRFRLLVRDPHFARLSATSESLRFSGEGDVESLLPIESTDLGQRLWRVLINEEGAVLQCNRRVFPTGTSAETYAPFCALVLPEALRQVLHYIANDPGMLEVEGSVWAAWQEWMHKLRIEAPPADDGLARSTWLDDATAAFCDEHRFVDVMQSIRE